VVVAQALEQSVEQFPLDRVLVVDPAQESCALVEFGERDRVEAFDEFLCHVFAGYPGIEAASRRPWGRVPRPVTPVIS
jgi:hypothetical protein